MHTRITRIFALMTAICLLLAGAAFAAGVPAVPINKLALRTGPNTKYVEMSSMPITTSLSAIEYEEGNDVTWVLVEYVRGGKYERGYTGLKRMVVNGVIPWADHDCIAARTTASTPVYSGPGEMFTLRCYLETGAHMIVLRYEDEYNSAWEHPTGRYAYVEYNDPYERIVSRGYVPAELVDANRPDDDFYPEWPQTGKDDAAVNEVTLPIPVGVMAGVPLRVNTGYGTSVLAAPGSFSGIVDYLSDGEYVSCLGTTDDGYAYVNIDNGLFGYIPLQYLALE